MIWFFDDNCGVLRFFFQIWGQQWEAFRVSFDHCYLSDQCTDMWSYLHAFLEYRNFFEYSSQSTLLPQTTDYLQAHPEDFGQLLCQVQSGSDFFYCPRSMKYDPLCSTHLRNRSGSLSIALLNSSGGMSLIAASMALCKSSTRWYLTPRTAAFSLSKNQ